MSAKRTKGEFEVITLNAQTNCNSTFSVSTRASYRQPDTMIVLLCQNLIANSNCILRAAQNSCEDFGCLYIKADLWWGKGNHLSISFWNTHHIISITVSVYNLYSRKWESYYKILIFYVETKADIKCSKSKLVIWTRQLKDLCHAFPLLANFHIIFSVFLSSINLVTYLLLPRLVPIVE